MLTRAAPRRWLCEDCLAAEADDLDAGAEAGPPLERREAEVADAISGELQLPAATVQATAPMPDLSDRDERVEHGRGLPDEAPPGWPLRYGRVSASALATFMRCPEQFRRRYVLGERDPSAGAAIAGKAAHVAIERNWRYRWEQGEDAPLWLLDEAVEASVTSQVERNTRYGFATDWGRDRSRGELDEWVRRAQARRAVTSYVEQVASTVEPLAAEEVFVARVAGVPVPLVGFIDLRTPRSVVDVKLSDRANRQIAPDWRAQGLAYLLPHDLDVAWHAGTWKGAWETPATAALVLPRTAANYAIASALVREAVAAILSYAERLGPEEPWLGNLTHTWACGACWFRPSCAWWPGGRLVDSLA